MNIKRLKKTEDELSIQERRISKRFDQRENEQKEIARHLKMVRSKLQQTRAEINKNEKDTTAKG